MSWRVYAEREKITKALLRYEALDDPKLEIPPSVRPQWALSYIDSYTSVQPIAIECWTQDECAIVLMRQEGSHLYSLFANTADYWDILYIENSIGGASSIMTGNCIPQGLHQLRASGIRSITFKGVLQDSFIANFLRLAPAGGGFNASYAPDAQLPFIRIQRDQISRWRGVNEGQLLEYEHKLERLLRAGRLTFIVNPDKASRIEFLAEARQAQISRWLHRGARSNWEDPRRELFINALVERASEAGFLQLFILLIDGKFAAMRLAFKGGGSLYGWTTSFSMHFKNYSPGALLLLLVLQECRDSGSFHTYELLRGTESWKNDWTKHSRQTQLINLSDSDGG